MSRFTAFFRRHGRLSLVLILLVLLLSGLLLYRLGSLTPGVSHGEAQVSTTPLGWHYLLQHPFSPVLSFLRSIVFYLSPQHTALGLRLPNALLGAGTMLLFGLLMHWWHGRRVAIIGTALFVTSAWVLHASRLASNDVLYLSILPILLVLYAALQRYEESVLVLLITGLLISFVLTIPGGVWLVLVWAFFSREAFIDNWAAVTRLWQRIAIGLASLLWVPLLLHSAIQQPAILKTWAGWPQHLGGATHLGKSEFGVLVHLFVRGPQYPDMWLGKAPILDILSLLLCVMGIYFYATHLQATRSRLLLAMGVVSVILIGLGGPVSLSLAVPLLYIGAAAGAGYLLRTWLIVFPLNPIARSFGIGLVIVAVVLSCTYNLRSYFVAWPHNPDTQAAFRYHP